MTTVAYTDGACSGNPGPGGWAWAIPGGRYASGFASHTTNQRMEVSAALEAVRAIEGPLEIVSDSTYVINCFRDKWWEGWLRRGWVNTQKKPVANRDLWEPFIELVRERDDVTFRWVKGHSGDPMNDLVDALAVEAGRSQSAASGEKPPSMGGAKATKGTAGDPELPQGHLMMVTGHKPPQLGGYGPNKVADAVRAKLREVIVAKAQLVPDLVVMTGLGLGVEQLAAEAALDAGVPFVVVLAYPEQESQWPKASQEHHQALLEKADGELLLQVAPPSSKQAAGALLARRNDWMARHVHEAVIVSDGGDPYLERLGASLRDHLGETEVWNMPVPEQKG
jgi:ribonuclease HI/uncharacterized phage-like protein YoqJ